MPHDVVVDVIVPDAPVVDVASVGVQGPPGEPGEPGPAGPAGEGAGPHAVTHQTGGTDPITLLDASVLTGTVTTNVIAPIVTATSNVSIGATPAQSGALRLGNNQAIVARNAANTTDLPLIVGDTLNDTHVGNAANESYIEGSFIVLNSPIVAAPTSLQVGATPAQSGAIRLTNGDEIKARNAANNADLQVVQVFSDNRIYVGSAAGDGGLVLRSVTGMVTVPPFVLFTETFFPGAAPANQAYVFLRDNGSGKSQLVVQFASGSPIVMATEV